MGQMTFIDEDKLNDLELRAFWCDVYKQRIEKIQKDIYPDKIYESPLSSAQAAAVLLDDIYYELKNKKKGLRRVINRALKGEI